ncbi:MAG: serine hydrolase [Bacteroidota bacterium]
MGKISSTMYMKWLIAGFFCLIFSNLLFSQNNIELLSRLQKEQEIVLLKNENDILPFKQLDKLSYGVLNIGSKSADAFVERCKSYRQPDFIENASNAALNNGSLPIDSVSTLILIQTDSTVEEKIMERLKSLFDDYTIIYVSLQGNSSIATQQWVDQAQVVVRSQDAEMLTQDYTAQLLFGGIAAKGALKEAIGDRYANGTGELTERSRLKYTIPEELGIDSDTLHKKVYEILEKGLRAQAFPGVQVMAVKSGKVFYHKAFGYHTYDSIRALQKDDIYDLASVTKVTGATLALMKLHDSGKFDLDAPAYTYWPDFTYKEKKQLTFRSILAHNAGLKSWIPYWITTKRKNGRYKKNTLSTKQDEKYTHQLNDSLFLHKDYKKTIYKMIRKSPPNQSPGYVYSGLSFYLYPEIVENLSGKPFESFLKDEFYGGLGAETIGFNAGVQYPLDRIVPTEVDTFFRMKPLHGVVHDEGAAMMRGISGNAGLFATANDLAKVWQMLLNEGSYGGTRYLSKQTIDKFTSCQYCEEGNRRGLGFDKPLIEYDPVKSSVSPLASYRSYGHSGYTGTFVWADPENELLFIFLSNRVYPTRNNRKIYQLNIRPDLHDVFNRLLK